MEDVSLLWFVIGSLSYFLAHDVRRSAGSYLASFELSPSHYCLPWSTAQVGDPSVKGAKLLFTVANLAGFQAFHLVLPTAGYRLLLVFGPIASGSVVFFGGNTALTVREDEAPYRLLS